MLFQGGCLRILLASVPWNIWANKGGQWGKFLFQTPLTAWVQRTLWLQPAFSHVNPIIVHQVLTERQRNRVLFYPRGCYRHTCYAVGTGWGMAGGSGFPPFCSEMGVVGSISSLGSTMLTWSGRGFLGPILPLGSQGSMIFTLMPSTPRGQDHG